MMAGSIASIFIHLDNPFEENEYDNEYSNYSNNNYNNYSNSNSYSSNYSYNKSSQSDYYTDDENLSVTDRIKNFINERFG